jgi:hypothetical protein
MEAAHRAAIATAAFGGRCDLPKTVGEPERRFNRVLCQCRRSPDGMLSPALLMRRCWVAANVSN